MKVLLINPKLTEWKTGQCNPKIGKARGRYPSLGLLSIAAVLVEARQDVKVIDCGIETDYFEKIEELLNSFKPDILGIHVTTWTFHEANKIAKFAKEIIPSLIVLAGGAAVTSLAQPVMKHSVFDYGVMGEGEITTIELINALQSGSDVKGIAGLIFRKDSQIRQNGTREFMQSIDSLPYPARDLVDVSRYYDVLTKERKFTTMITSRGCPYQCVYCDRKNRMGRAWRSFSNKRIMDEIKELYHNYNIKEIMFFDDEFIVNRNKTLELCDMILSEGLKISWECRARVDMVDAEVLSLMKKAGCYRVRFGFESGDDGILKILKKNITVSQSLECAKMARSVGMDIFGYFMLGAPYETEETMQKTIDLALEIDPQFALFSKTILIPGSELFEWAVSEKIATDDHWDRFISGEITKPTLAISTKTLPESTVDEFISYANKKFYLRPKFIIKRLTETRNASQLYRRAVMACSLFGG